MRARSTHRAEIEDQFLILSQMADEIKVHFQDRIDEIEQIAKDDAINQANGDLFIYSSVLNSYANERERRWTMCTQSRQIVFCATYAYYEAMLNRIIRYYNITINNNDLKDAKSMFTRISEELLQRSNGRIRIADDEFSNDYCRLLRNHFMHGILSKKVKRDELKKLSDKYGGIIYDEAEYAAIKDHSFLLKVLNSIYKMIINIDDEYSSIGR